MNQTRTLDFTFAQSSKYVFQENKYLLFPLIVCSSDENILALLPLESSVWLETGRAKLIANWKNIHSIEVNGDVKRWKFWISLLLLRNQEIKRKIKIQFFIHLLVDAKISFHNRELSIHLDEFVLLLMEFCKQRKYFPLNCYLNDDGDMQIRHTMHWTFNQVLLSIDMHDNQNDESLTSKASVGNNSRGCWRHRHSQQSNWMMKSLASTVQMRCFSESTRNSM